MSDDPTQDPSTFDPDEDLFNFDEVALEFYSSNDEEDLEEIFKAFEAGIEEENDLGFDFDTVDDEPSATEAQLPEASAPETDVTEAAPEVASAPAQEEPSADPLPEPTPTPPAAAAPAPAPETFRADPKPTPPPAPAPIADPLPTPQTYPAPAQAPSAPAQVAAQPAPPPPPAPQVYPATAPQPAPAPAPAAAPAPNVTPPQVFPAPMSLNSQPEGEGDGTSRFALLDRLKGTSPILLAVTVMNALLAVVILKRPSTPTEPEQTPPAATTQHIPDALPVNEVITPPTIAAPQPERHPTFALAHEEISRGEYGAARRRIYGLLSIIDRLNTEEREAIEARAQHLLAEAQHLEALARLEDKR